MNEEQHKQLTLVRSSARPLLALVSDLEDLSKIAAGQLRIARAGYSRRAVVERVTASVRPQPRAKGVSLEVRLSPEADRAIGDARRVEQALLKLVSTAIKFPNRAEEEVRVEPTDAGRRWHLQVQDSGCRVAPRPTETFPTFPAVANGSRPPT